jgi:hypothetical protein
MSYSYIVHEDFTVSIKDKDNIVIDNPGPWASSEDANDWASRYVESLNSGQVPDPRTVAEEA